MKKTLLTILGIILTAGLFAQEIPQKISYQGKLYQNDTPVNGTKSIKFTIGSWTETHNSVQINNGLYSVQLGNITPIPPNVFSSSDATLQIAVEGNNLSPQTDILSVPYAYKAEKAVTAENVPTKVSQLTNDKGYITSPNDADASSTNEIQSLSISGSTLKISGGNSVTLPGSSGSADNWGTQTVQTNATLSGTGTSSSKLGIARQNASTGQVMKWNGSAWAPSNDDDSDGDTDSNNEIQTISLNGNTLSISDGNSISLPTGGDSGAKLNQGNGIALSPNPIVSDGTIALSGNYEGSFIASTSLVAGVPSSSYGGGDIVADDDILADDDMIAGGDIVAGDDIEAADCVSAGDDVEAADDVKVGDDLFVEDAAYFADKRIFAEHFEGSNGDRTGVLRIRDKSRKDVVFLGAFGGNRDIGGLSLLVGGAANSQVLLTASAGGGGMLYLGEDNGSTKISLNGKTGVISGTSKQFRITHPNDETKEIVYTSLEGPEAAAYFRGTISLKNGRALIKYPEHFELVTNLKTVTIILTPLSLNSSGLAVEEKGSEGIKIGELHNGTGNYDVDFEVKGVRLGYEDYQVIQEKLNITN